MFKVWSPSAVEAEVGEVCRTLSGGEMMDCETEMRENRFGCVYCGERVDYDKKTKALVCSNKNCPEDNANYGCNILRGCVWVKISEKQWKNVPKGYVLSHISEFIGKPNPKRKPSVRRG